MSILHAERHPRLLPGEFLVKPAREEPDEKWPPAATLAFIVGTAGGFWVAVWYGWPLLFRALDYFTYGGW